MFRRFWNWIIELFSGRPCPLCDGTGRWPETKNRDEQGCLWCRGRGRIM